MGGRRRRIAVGLNDSGQGMGVEKYIWGRVTKQEAKGGRGIDVGDGTVKRHTKGVKW